MKLTKVLKEYVEEQMNKARYKANKEARADYVARQEKVEEEIKTYLAEVVNPHIEEILKANDMDLTAERWGDKKPASEHILQFASQYILNKEEKKVLDEAETKRAKKQDELMKQFTLDCELGVDKEHFYEEVKKLIEKI
jgi:hypothetical protein